MRLPKSLEKVITEFSKLPGIGPKSAQRLALYLLKKDNFDIEQLSVAIRDLKNGVIFCSNCHNMTDSDPCTVCSDKNRDHKLICVVEEPLDAQALDKAGNFNGVFHVLGGVLNPMEGIGPENLKIKQLLERVPRQEVQEVILATNPTLEGETTASYISKLLAPASIKVTRIARGLPMGGDLEYADQITLLRALEGRRDI